VHRFKLGVGGFLGATFAAPAFAGYLLGLLGFGALGPLAGGMAAAFQAWVGIVPAGGLFAGFQAAGMVGISWATAIVFGGIVGGCLTYGPNFLIALCGENFGEFQITEAAGAHEDL